MSSTAVTNATKALDAGDRIQAIEILKEAADTDSSAAFMLALHLDLLGEEKQAIEYATKASEGDHPPVNTLLSLAIFYEDACEYEKAEGCLRRILTADPTHKRARMYLRDVIDALAYKNLQLSKRKSVNVMNKMLTDFNLTPTTRNVLIKYDWRTFADLTRISEAQMRAHNVHEATIDELRRLLAQKNLKFGQNTNIAERESVARELQARGIDPAILDDSVGVLNLSSRARNALKLLAVETLGDLCVKKETDLMGIKNFGQTSLDEIKLRLHDNNLNLKQ